VALFTVVAALAVLSAPSSLLAKGATVRVVITGPDIPQSIEITEASSLSAFNVWTGPGTSSNEDVGFIVKWSQTVAPPPATAVRYQLSFYTEDKADQPSYVVFYSYDASTKLGYVYLPGPGESGYTLNIGSIWHGVEGRWLRARDDWNATALPFIFPLSDSSLRPFSTCDAHEFTAHLTTTDPSYSDALKLERKLTANGVTVQCICESKMQSFFPGQKGAAWFHTASGVFDALFFRNSEDSRAIQVTEQRNGARFLYSFPEASSAPRMDSSKPESFLRVANALLVVWGNEQLASILSSQFPESDLPR
jgi:hypothetical protein